MPSSLKLLADRLLLFTAAEIRRAAVNARQKFRTFASRELVRALAAAAGNQCSPS